MTPVLTAGKTFVLGYTNEKDGIFSEGLPVIIFDDFTTSTQFVDFPFKAKSSAMKILQAKKSANIKFMYEVLQKISYYTDTHERHWISKFAPMPVKIPRLREQQKIADCLSSLDERIISETDKLNALKTHKKGLLKQLFPAEGETTPKVRFPEFQDAGEWRKIQLSKIATPVCGRATDGDADAVLTLSAEYGVVAQGAYFGKKVAGDNVQRYIKIKNNDFIYNDRTTKIYKYGTIKRLSEYSYGIVSPIYKCFRFNHQQVPVFWEWYFESGKHDTQLHSIINEGGKEGRFNISIHKFLSTLVYLPSELEQQRIADSLSSLDELIAAQARKIELLKTHKKGLLQQLFPAFDEADA